METVTSLTGKAKAETAVMELGSVGVQPDLGQSVTAAAPHRVGDDLISEMGADRLAGIVGAWIGFSACCIKSGESWSSACEKMKADAFAALNELADRALPTSEEAGA